MISPDHFERFVVPHTNRLAGELGPMRFHSCGASDHLIEPCTKLEPLAVFNVGSSTSIAKIREILGDVPIDVSPDAELLTNGSPADIDRWVETILAENGDGRLEIQYHLDLGQPEETALQIHRTLSQRGMPARRKKIY